MALADPYLIGVVVFSHLDLATMASTKDGSE